MKITLDLTERQLSEVLHTLHLRVGVLSMSHNVLDKKKVEELNVAINEVENVLYSD